MAEFSFADSYKLAGLEPGPEIIRLRQAGFDKIRKEVSLSNLKVLTRLYFGLPPIEDCDWFRIAFLETDPSFSLIQNEREVSVLAACLLGATMTTDDGSAALLVLTTSAGGHRVPCVQPGLVEDARLALHETAASTRRREDIDPKKLTFPAKGKAPSQIEAFITAPELAKVGEIANSINSESNEAIKNLTRQLQGLLSPLLDSVAFLQEEVDILWWYVSGWSRSLEKPFSSLAPAFAGIVAGIDLADLSKFIVGPVSATAILYRLISALPGDSQEKFSIAEAVDSVPEEFCRIVGLIDSEIPSDICPILAALQKASKIGPSPSWHLSFEKEAQLKVKAKFTAFELAVQVYRERLLLSSLI